LALLSHFPAITTYRGILGGYPFGVSRLVECGPGAESAQLSSPYEHS
jgi:hypothetical protein